jgi:CBS-domain-containing membrane protein
MDFLATIKAPSPVFPNDQNAIISVGADAPVSEAFQVLIKNGVLAAPVFDYTENKYCYMFSIRDVVYHALRVLDETQFTNEDIPAMTFMTEKDHFRNYKVKDIVGHKEKLVEVGTEDTVDKVVAQMVQANAHRVVSLNKDGSLNNIITQSRVVECLVQLFDVSPSLGALGKQTVKDLGLAKTGSLVSVRDSDKAVQAFRLMCENNVSGLPVLSSNNTLVGNISESDLRAIQSNAQYLKLLYLPVSEYLEAMKKHPRTSKKGQDVVKCELIDTYRTVVERVVESRVHRCYVVDDAGLLIGVISLQNLLAALVKFSPPAP